MTLNKTDVFGVGNAIVDIIAFVDDDFILKHNLRKGDMTLIDAAKQSDLLRALKDIPLEMRSGGSAANTMIGLAMSGGTGCYTGKVSKDSNGDFYREDVLKSGIHFDVTPLDESKGPTATCVVLITPDAERTMYTHLGVSAELSPDDIQADKLKASQYAYLEGYLWFSPEAQKTTLYTMQKAKESGVKVAYGYSASFCVDAARDDFRKVTKDYCDLIFCNSDEARTFTQTEDIRTAAGEIGTLAENVYVTDGKEGVYVVYKGKITKIEGFHVKAIDTVGAGDNFASGVLYGLTHGYSPQASAYWGNYLASKVVQVVGARLNESEKDRAKILLNEYEKSNG